MLRAKKTLLVKLAVLSFERYLSCPKCKSKVQEIDSICGQCTKCDGVVKLSKCPSNMLAKVKLEDDQGKRHFATMFTSVILSIIENEEGNVSTKLLQSSQMVFTINNRDIITQVSEEASSQVRSSQELENSAIAAKTCFYSTNQVLVKHESSNNVTGENHGENQSKTWREDPIVE